MGHFKITVKNIKVPEDAKFTIATDNPYLHVSQQVDEEIRRVILDVLEYDVEIEEVHE